MLGINPLPGKKETAKLLDRDRLNFRAQPVDGEPMNARQQASLAPFGASAPILGATFRILRARRAKFSAQDKSFGLQSEQCGIDLRRREQQNSSQLIGSNWTANLQPSSNQFADRISLLPVCR